MPTRFYLPSSGTPFVSGLSIAGFWNLPGGSDPEIARLPMYTSKQDTALTTFEKTWAGTSTQTWCLFQFQSEQFLSTFNFNGGEYFHFIARCAEQATSVDTFWSWYAYLIDGSDSFYADLGGTITAASAEFPVYGSDATRGINDSLAYSATAPVGGRLIFELAVYGVTPATQNFRFRLGDPTATSDFPFGTSTSDLVPWMEIDATGMDLGTAPDSVLSGSSTQTQETASGTLTITHPDSLIDGSSTQTQETASGTLTITHPDSLIDGSSTQAVQVSIGGVNVNDEYLLYGSSTQNKQSNYGVLFIPLDGEVAAPTPAGTAYQLLLDSTEYPMVRASVNKQVGVETADVTIPSALFAGIQAAAPTTLTINVLRTVNGVTSSQELFTGALSLSGSSSSALLARLYAVGTASYTTPTNRLLAGNPMYIREADFDTAVRGAVNPAVVPGDVLRYSNVRELWINRIVFNIDQHYSFMEVSSGF